MGKEWGRSGREEVKRDNYSRGIECKLQRGGKKFY